MKIILVIDGDLVVLTAFKVDLFSDYGVINAEGLDEAGEFIGGQRMLWLNDTMQTVEVDELPAPWVDGAYRWIDDMLQRDTSTWAWQAYLVKQDAAFAERVKLYDGVVQGHIDAVARGFGYGDPNRPDVSPILHAISYADEPAVPKFQAEGRLLRAWRSRMWAACWPILEAARTGQRQVPDPDDLLAELLAGAPAPTPDDVVAELAAMV